MKDQKTMKKLLFTISIVGMCMALMGCESFLGGDTNTDPTRVSEDKVGPAELLPTAIFYTSQAHFNIAYTSAQYSQQLASYFTAGADAHEESPMASGWVNVYLNALNNLDQLEEKAIENDSPHYLGITKTLQALNLGLATSTWEAVPFDEAFQENNFTPAYDSQEKIYGTINQLLDDAITELQKEDNYISPPGQDDLLYDGDINKWIKTAYALKARFAIHETNKGAVAAAQEALSALGNAFEANDDDVQIVYTSKNLNPWHTTVALSRQTGNFTVLFSEQLINAMNGERYNVFDPRLPVIADNGDDENYYGGRNGSGGESSINSEGGNADLGLESWYSSEMSPILMITYAEMKFIEAEAAFLRDNGGDAFATGGSPQAYQAYLDGIEAHMNKLGVSQEDQEDYLTDPNVAVGALSLNMELIMNEKNKALLLNPEVWNDLRRYDYDEAIFRDLQLPDGHLLDGEWIQRGVYPSSEFSRNETEVRKVEKEPEAKMWIFQES